MEFFVTRKNSGAGALARQVLRFKIFQTHKYQFLLYSWENSRSITRLVFVCLVCLLKILTKQSSCLLISLLQCTCTSLLETNGEKLSDKMFRRSVRGTIKIRFLFRGDQSVLLYEADENYRNGSNLKF
jgi:hypothetical protein